VVRLAGANEGSAGTIAAAFTVDASVRPAGYGAGVSIVMEPYVSPEEIQPKLTQILRDVFDDEALVATPDLTASDVDGWDSVNHVRLILSVERAFKIKFTASEVTSLKKLGDLTKLIAAKTA
jgi:acyl carrier protein